MCKYEFLNMKSKIINYIKPLSEKIGKISRKSGLNIDVSMGKNSGRKSGRKFGRKKIRLEGSKYQYLAIFGYQKRLNKYLRGIQEIYNLLINREVVHRGFEPLLPA